MGFGGQLRLLGAVLVFIVALVWTGAAAAHTDMAATTIISGSVTWSGTVTVTDDVTIATGGTLTLAAGTVVNVAAGKRFTVNGTLVAGGTAASNVTITSAAATPAAGDWNGIDATGGGTVALAYTTVSYAGKANASSLDGSGQIGCTACALTLFHATVANGSAYGVVGHASAFTLQSSTVDGNSVGGVLIDNGSARPVLTDNTFSGNGFYGADVWSTNLGSITGNTTTGNDYDAIRVKGGISSSGAVMWDNDATIVVQDVFSIASGAELKLGAGQTVKLQFGGALKLGGSTAKLTALGTSSDRVFITSLLDDSRGGQTGPTSFTPSPGAWNGIDATGGGIVSLSYTDVAYGGQANSSVFEGVGQIGCLNCTLALDHILVTDGSAEGVVGRPAAFSMTDSTARNHASTGGSGIDIFMPSARPVVSNNTFTGNGGYAAFVHSPDLGSITGNASSGNGYNAIQIGGGISSAGAVTWDNDLTLAVNGTFSIGSGAELKLAAGQVVKVLSLGGLRLAGATAKLTAFGTSSERVFITSFSDGTRGGDVRPSMPYTPTAGDWNGIDATSGGIVSLSYTDVAYGGQANSGTPLDGAGQIGCSGCALALDHVLITNGSTSGVVGHPSSLSLTDSTLRNHASITGSGLIVDTGSARPVITDNSFTGNGGYAGFVKSSDLGSLTGNSGSGNDINAIQVSGGISSAGAVTWDNDLTLAVYGTFSIANGAELKLAAGQVVKVLSLGGLRLAGATAKLTTLGTAADRVFITSFSDGTRGGDVRPSMPYTPTAGDWNGIDATSGGTVSLAYTDVAYGGSANSAVADGHGQIGCTSCTLQLDHVVVTDGADDGVVGSPSSISISDSTIKKNGDNGVSVNGAGQIAYSLVLDNGGWGIGVAGGSPTIRNVDVVGNVTGIATAAGSAPVLHSSIVRGNTQGINSAGGAFAIDHSIISGNTTQFVGLPNPIGSNGNLDIDPAFVDEATRDLHLRRASAAIDNGRPGLTDPDGTALDIGALPFGHAQVAVDATDAAVVVGNPVTVAIQVTGFGSASLPLAIRVTGANPQTATLTTDVAGQASLTYTPANAGTDSVLVAADGNGNGVAEAGEASHTATVTVSLPNQPPAADAGVDQTVDEGSLVTLDGSGSSDPDGNPLAYSWTQVAGLPVTLSSATAKQPTFTPGDDGVYSFRLVVNDGTVDSAPDQVDVTVRNVAPVVGAITAPTTPVPVGTAVTATAPFTDAGFLDTHASLWNWGDGTTSAGTVAETNGAGTTSGTHVYTTPGVYTLTDTVTDDDGGSGASLFQYVVVFDSSGGFVTGTGWFDSPAGAYVPNPSLTGRAQFGFVSKYKPGATVPTGSTRFQLKTASFDFQSSVYDVLVVAGARAQFRGTGTINGAGSYGFVLTAIDGQVAGGGGSDKLRIKIWDKATGAIVYDNGGGAGDDADPTTLIGGGEIVVHKS